MDHSLLFDQNINRSLLHQQAYIGDTLGSEEMGVMSLWCWKAIQQKRKPTLGDVEERWRIWPGQKNRMCSEEEKPKDVRRNSRFLTSM